MDAADTPSEPTCLSFRPIPVPVWARVSSDTLDYTVYKHVTNLPTMLYTDTCINPTCRLCCNIAAPLPQRIPYQQVNQPTLLFTSMCSYEVTIHITHCVACQHVMTYDGFDDRIFRYSHRRLFSHELMNRFIADVTCSETPYHAFITKMRRSYEGTTRYEFPSQHLFMDAVTCYTSLQAWDYTFSCPTCGSEPSQVICDGTSLSIPRDYSLNLDTPIKVQSTSTC